MPRCGAAQSSTDAGCGTVARMPVAPNACACVQRARKFFVLGCAASAPPCHRPVLARMCTNRARASVPQLPFLEREKGNEETHCPVRSGSHAAGRRCLVLDVPSPGAIGRRVPAAGACGVPWPAAALVSRPSPPSQGASDRGKRGSFGRVHWHGPKRARNRARAWGKLRFSAPMVHWVQWVQAVRG
jgi:hypothetical protein